MTMSYSWRQTLLHSALVVLIAILSGVVHVFIENDLRLPDPILKLLPGMGLYPSVLRSINATYLWLFTFGGLIATIVFLFRARFVVALSYLLLTASVFVASHVSVVLKGSRFSFPEKSHDKIVEIYRQRRPTTGLSRPVFNFHSQQKFNLGDIPDLVALGEECHPPYLCECWIAWGPALNRGIDKEVDRDWHAPRSALFPASRPEYFAIVHVRPIDADAYSVIGCAMDLRR
jgi:hypothetical protein